MIHNIYRQATAEPFAFLYVSLTAKEIDQMFWINFCKQITVDEEYEEEEQLIELDKHNIDYYNVQHLKNEYLRKY